MGGEDLRLSPDQRERILRELWILNDGRWFVKTSQEHGFDEATRLNLMVVESFGRSETRLLMQEAGIKGIADAEELAAYLRLASDLFLPPKHKRQFRILDENTVLAQVSDCNLYRHLTAAGTAQRHQCGAHTRFSAWLQALGVRGRVEVTGSSATCEGACEVYFHLHWPGSET